MSKILKPETEERPIMILCGIMTLYLLIIGFIIYLFLLHRLNLSVAVISGTIFTGIYIPRFLILNKKKKKDDVKIIDEYLMINNNGIHLSEIEDYRVKEPKPQVIFFINNKMIVYQEAEFHLKTQNGQISFKIIGTEKINLLKEFLDNIIQSWYIYFMGQDYKKLLNKKKKKYCDIKTMGVNIDKNEYYEIILSNSANPEGGTKGSNK